MNSEEANALIEMAMAKGFIASTQAGQLKEEFDMFPGNNVITLMLRRNLIDSDQGISLLEAVKSQSDPHHDEEMEMDFGAGKVTPPLPVPPAKNSRTDNIETNSSLGNALASQYKPASPMQPAAQPPSLASAKPAGSTEPPPKRSMSEGLGFARSAMLQVSKPVITNSTTIDPELVAFIRAGRDSGASDLHLTPGLPPYTRQEGELHFLNDTPLNAEKTQKLGFSVLTPEQRELCDKEHQLDFSFESPGNGRYRANIYKQRNGMEAAFRFIQETVPTLESLKMPEVLEKLTTYPQGLNLVTGPGGCGKTTTVAAMLEYINCHRHEHIITVEDPIEYVFQPKSCQITQREVGKHTRSFAHALKTALRQDPDVIMIGELRDLETTSIAITAAETGHLVFGTLHTASAVRTVARILDVYPPSQRSQICLMVAESLRGIISQQLLPRKDGKGRVCAMEILVVTTGVAQVIKEGKTHQLVSHMQSGRKLGMKSMDDALMELLKAGQISGSVAWSASDNKSLFEMTRTQ